jgi:hypothetical protein
MQTFFQVIKEHDVTNKKVGFCVNSNPGFLVCKFLRSNPKMQVVENEEILMPLRYVKDPEELAAMGKAAKRVDGRDKVTGKAQFAGDIRAVDMLYARVLRPPAHGATLKSVDTSAAEKMPGVTVINEGGLIATLHKDPEAAEAAGRRMGRLRPYRHFLLHSLLLQIICRDYGRFDME